MKQPYEINSDFFKKMISSGWYPERDIVLEKLPSHIEDLPSVVKKFLREIWYISVTKDFYMQDNYKRYIFSNDVYTFGETTQELIDYLADKGEYNVNDKKIRNFGFKSGREILIDESGGIYEIPDSGDIYYVGGKFYEGLYNLIFTRGTSYLINDTGSLFIESKEGLISANINIEDII